MTQEFTCSTLHSIVCVFYDALVWRLGFAAVGVLLYAMTGCATASEYASNIEVYNASAGTWIKVHPAHVIGLERACLMVDLSSNLHRQL